MGGWVGLWRGAIKAEGSHLVKNESHLHRHVLFREQAGEGGIGGCKDGDARRLPQRDGAGEPGTVQRGTEGAQVVVVEGIVDGRVAVCTCAARRDGEGAGEVGEGGEGGGAYIRYYSTGATNSANGFGRDEGHWRVSRGILSFSCLPAPCRKHSARVEIANSGSSGDM